MSLMTYDVSHAPQTAAPIHAEQGVFSRLYDRFIAYRQAQAMIELRRHSLLLPQELEQAGWKINERSEDSLPFVR